MFPLSMLSGMPGAEVMGGGSGSMPAPTFGASPPMRLPGFPGATGAPIAPGVPTSPIASPMRPQPIFGGAQSSPSPWGGQPPIASPILGGAGGFGGFNGFGGGMGGFGGGFMPLRSLMGAY